MKWAIGLDFRREGLGALAFARWLHDGGSDDTFVALHVLEASPLLQALREPEEEKKALDRARVQATSELERAGLGDVEGPVVLDGELPGEALAHTLGELGARALVIGRRAETQDTRWLRLGPVARRLLRRLPGPVVVVPPDLTLESVGEGPVILATDLGDDSVGAARFAKQVAEARGCPLLVSHIVPPSDAGTMFLPAATVEQLYEQLGLDARKSLEKWKREVGLTDSPSAVASGDTLGRLLGIASGEKSPLVVCGSRRTSPITRLFTASVGTALASYAPCPVAVVPADWDA